jgi:hypothetical protein
MALPLSINNPQTSEPISSANPTATGQTVTYAGNSIGGTGGSASGGTTDLSTILVYGVVGLGIVFILKAIEGKS